MKNNTDSRSQIANHFQYIGEGPARVFINCSGGDESGLSTETHTGAHSWGRTWWWAGFSAAWSSKSCFPGDAATCTRGRDESLGCTSLDEPSPPNPALRELQNCSRAGACALTSANNKPSSPLVHLPNHGSLKISARWERALHSMICPRPHRKPVAKLEIEPKGSQLQDWGLAWLPILRPFPTQCWGNTERWVGQNHLACTYLSPAWCQDTLAAGAQWDLCTPRWARWGLGPMKRSGKILPCSGGFWFIFSPPACLFYSCCWQGEGYLIRAEGQMLSTTEQEAGLLLRCKPSDGHKTTYRGVGGKEID